VVKLVLVSQPYDRLFPPTQNSIGLIAYHTALNLASRNEITIYRKDYREDVVPADFPVRVESIRVNLDRGLQRIIRSFPALAAGLGIDGRIDDHREYRRKVAARVKQDRPDVVHLMNYWNWARELRPAGAPHRLVLEMQCEWLSQRSRDAVAAQLEAVDAVVTVSDHIARTFRGAFPGYAGPVVTVGNGVDVERFNPRPERAAEVAGGRRVILFVGRISPEKGLHTLLEAFAAVAGRLDDVDLVIAGPHAALTPDFLTSLSSDAMVHELLRFYDRSGACLYPAHLEALLDRHGLRDRVRFLGALSQQELVGVYQQADVVVNPSLSESFGISVVEGMASGLPVVGTRVGGMCETIVDSVTGHLVAPEAPEALAEALLAILTDADRLRAMGSEGRRRAVRHFSWRARADRLNAVYECLAVPIRRPPLPRPSVHTVRSDLDGDAGIRLKSG
jgi:glycosyltransferase involved in cell wall biosynthesis